MRGRAWWLIVLAPSLGCSTATDPGDAGIVDAAATDHCMPHTCSSAGAECGSIDDGCGHRLACGACPAEQRCGLVVDGVCGGECQNDRQCPVDMVCDIQHAVCQSGCRGPSTEIGIDVPTVAVRLHFTLGGEPLPVENGSANGPLIVVAPPPGPDDDGYLSGVTLPIYAPGETMRPSPEPIDLVLARGDYVVGYLFDPIGEDDGFARDFPHMRGPQGSDWGPEPVAIAPLHVPLAGGDVTIDIPRVRFGVRVTIDGAPLVPARHRGALPRLVLRGTHHYLVDVPLYDGATTVDASAFWILPDDYRITYEYDGDVPDPITPAQVDVDWPIGHAIDLGPLPDDASALAIDLQTAWLTVSTTLDGMPLPVSPSLPTPIEAPRIDVVRDGVVQFAIPIYDSLTQAQTPFAIRVLSGTTTLRYHAGVAEYLDSWPIANADLQTIDLQSSTRVALDVPRTRVELTVSAGDVFDWASCAGPYAPRLHVGGNLVSIGPEPGARSVWLVPASYPLRYEGALCIDHSGVAWPQGSLELDALDASTQTRTIDIPAVDARFAITWGGGPLPTTHTVHAVPLALVLTLPESPPPGAAGFAAIARVDLYTRAGELVTPPTVRVIPGAYDVWLATEINEETFVGGAVAQSLVLGDAAVSIDLPRAVDVTGIVTLDGAPLPSVGMNGYATSVVARSLDPRLATAVTLTWPHAHPAFVSRINPGTYALVLSTGGEAIDGPFPAIDARLGCWIVPSP